MISYPWWADSFLTVSRVLAIAGFRRLKTGTRTRTSRKAGSEEPVQSFVKESLSPPRL